MYFSMCFSECVSVSVFQCVYRSLVALVARTQLARRHCMSIRVDGKTDDVIRVAEVKGLCVCRGVEDDSQGSGIVDHLQGRSRTSHSVKGLSGYSATVKNVIIRCVYS